MGEHNIFDIISGSSMVVPYRVAIANTRQMVKAWKNKTLDQWDKISWTY